MAYVPHSEDEVGRSFDDRTGLICIWAIPQSSGLAVEEETEVNTMQTVYALAGGFELRVTASASSADPLFALAWAAATNMGYS